MKTIQELMSNKSQYCCSKDSIEEASEKMRHSGLDSLIVLDENNSVVGTVSYLDLCLAPAHKSANIKEMIVEQFMNKHVMTINLQDDETLAFNLMRQLHLKSLPVIDEENKLKGSIRFITLARRIISFRHCFKNSALTSLHSELV